MEFTGAEHLRADELSVYDGVVQDGSRTICLAHWLKSKCRRAYELSRQLKAEGLFYESQTMLELRQLLHDRWSSSTMPQEIERLVRRLLTVAEVLFGRCTSYYSILSRVGRMWLVVLGIRQTT